MPNLMKTYRITVTLADGSRGRCWGVYPNPWMAISAIQDSFPGAKVVSAVEVAL